MRTTTARGGNAYKNYKKIETPLDKPPHIAQNKFSIVVFTLAIAFLFGLFGSCKNDTNDANIADENPKTNYTITYELNGGSDNKNPETYTAKDLPLSLTSPKKEGFVLEGWYESKDFSGNAVRQITQKNIGNKTLYAKWVEEIEFTAENIENATFVAKKLIKVTGPITEDTIETLHEKTKSLSEIKIILDLSEATGIDSIPDYAFYKKNGRNYTGNASLVRVILPNCVTSIGESAFSDCTSLTSVEIPSSVTSIGRAAFSNCTSLTKVETPSIEDWLGIHFKNADSNPLRYAKHLYVGGTEFTTLDLIPGSVTTISDCAFAGWALKA